MFAGYIDHLPLCWLDLAAITAIFYNFLGVDMPTVYVNDLHYRREFKNGSWFGVYTTGSGDDGDPSPCDYGYELPIRESSIVTKQAMGICRSGGRSWKITYNASLVDQSRKKLTPNTGNNPLLPENVKSLFVGNGHIIWTVTGDDKATSIAFVPLLNRPPTDPNPDPGDPNPDPGDPNPDPGDPNPDPGDPNPDPGDPNPGWFRVTRKRLPQS
jgi:hypothetical protein